MNNRKFKENVEKAVEEGIHCENMLFSSNGYVMTVHHSYFSDRTETSFVVDEPNEVSTGFATFHEAKEFFLSHF